MPTQFNAPNTKLWVVIGVGVAGVLILAEVHRRRIRAKRTVREDFGAFVERFNLLPFPQPPPPAAPLSLCGLTFALNDNIDVKGYVTGHGSADRKRLQAAAETTAVVVTIMLKNGATCVGKTVMDELGYGLLGENKTYGTPINPQDPSHSPGGSSSGSAVAVAAQLVDFALGTDTTGCIRVPASFCGIIGFRPSHGIVSTIGVSPNSQSLDTVGCFASDPLVLHRLGHALLQLNPTGPKRTRSIVIADDLFQFSKVHLQKTGYVISKTVEKLSGYQAPKHVNFGQYIASQVPSLKIFSHESTDQRNGMSTLKALSSATLLLQRYEFKTNHEDWVRSVKPRLGSDVSRHVWAALDTIPENVKSLYKVRSQMRDALKSLLKDPNIDSLLLKTEDVQIMKKTDIFDDGVLITPTVADPPPKLNSKKGLQVEFYDRMYSLLSIASMSGGCQVSIPFGTRDNSPISISFLASHGNDKFLLDTVLDMYSSLQEVVDTISSSSLLVDTNRNNIDAAELLKEKGNTAYKRKQWNKAAGYYTDAIKLNETNATYYCNRAAVCLELGCFRQAEEDCTKAISLDKKNVKAYLRRGKARESLLLYREALQDFKHAFVLEPQNKAAAAAEKRLLKLIP